MESEAAIGAPAKINLHLHVGGRRNDGFHELVSLLHMVALQDDIVIRSLKEPGVCRIDGNFPFPQKDNIITKAVRALWDHTGVHQGVQIGVKKRIPMGAGLGGGSSDAAAVLRGMNTLFYGLKREELEKISASIGSDVPFFLSSTVALVEGRGELVTPVSPRRDLLYGVICYPEVHIDTGSAYKWYDEAVNTIDEKPLEPDSVVADFRNRRPEAWKYYNSFYSVLSERYPVLDKIRASLFKEGALFAQLTGSGSAVFGLFQNETEAKAAEKNIHGSVKFATYTHLLKRVPEPTVSAG